MSAYPSAFDEKDYMGLFSRKKQVEQPVEERKVSLGGLLFNSTSSYSNSFAMKLSAVYCATNQISNSVAMLPINIVRYDQDEKRPISHPVWKILNVAPDKKYNHFNIWKQAIESVILQGNAYFLIERDERLNVKSLNYINADFVQPMMQEDGSVKYLVTGMNRAVESSEMVHLWMHVDENFNGISLLRYAYNTLSSAADTEKTSNNFFKGGAGLNGVLKASATLTNDQKKQIRTSWLEAFSNGGNGVAVLPQGVDYQSVSVNPKDAQLLESQEFNVVQIARFFNISPIKLFQLDEVSYSSMESTELYYLSDTIMPYVKMVEEELNRKLFKPSEVGKLGVQFDFKEAMKTNKQAEGEYYRMMLTNGILSINEIRGELGLPRIESAEGDVHYLQLSYGNAKDIAEGKYVKQQQQSPGNDQIDAKQKQGDK